MKFRKKPVVVDAVLWDGDESTWPKVLDLADAHRGKLYVDHRREVVIGTLEGDMQGRIGDWIVRGVQGELYPCKPEIFEATNEPVTEDLT